MAVKTYFKHSSKKQRYNITIDNKTLHCNTLDDAIETIERAAGYDIDAVFSEEIKFEIYDTNQKVIVATNESITHLAVERNDYESETLYVYLCEYMADYE
ncbi:MAG: hypothetical protein KBS62_07860 [Oscillospiraceae bacterium]|nr:hypothetical protein [Candidatus Ruminococcus equi]